MIEFSKIYQCAFNFKLEILEINFKIKFLRLKKSLVKNKIILTSFFFFINNLIFLK